MRGGVREARDVRGGEPCHKPGNEVLRLEMLEGRCKADVAGVLGLILVVPDRNYQDKRKLKTTKINKFI